MIAALTFCSSTAYDTFPSSLSLAHKRFDSVGLKTSNAPISLFLMRLALPMLKIKGLNWVSKENPK
jgi:hypothetical protein